LIQNQFPFQGVELSISDGRGVDIEEEEKGAFLEIDSDTEIFGRRMGECEVKERDRLKGEVRTDQSENASTVLVSSSGWAPAEEGTISSEDRVARNFILLELERLVSWRRTRSYRLEERKEQFGTTR